MQSPCRNRSGRAVTALAENKALRGKNPRQISGCLLFLPGIFHVFFRVPALHMVLQLRICKALLKIIVQIQIVE